MISTDKTAQSLAEQSTNRSAVPDRSHYAGDYAGKWRIHSFAHQIETSLELKPKTILEIGVGAGVVAAALKAVGIQVTTLDIEPSLKPSIIGSVTHIPFQDHCFDVGLCCQVLEHLPFDMFHSALRELNRVTKVGLVLSLPDATREYHISAQLPIIHRRNVSLTIGRLRPPQLTESYFKLTGHFWEIGTEKTPLTVVKQHIVSSGWRIARTWRLPEMTWHRFFELKPA
ncbi:MAG TPA: methyltransferase domain-containing protein [Tepidisphaeraceae bacterium]|jgi:ubiquinone/menaquinone biosynthesis C-methylase UbiE|nr:methyltransferase domain-containing protein [Tepidisphaeraceae bacterium]